MILKPICAAALLAAPVAASAPAEPQTVAVVPVDATARAKFPTEDGKVVDALAAINLFVNTSMTYQDDKSHYGYNDFWVMAPNDAKGDCEDYALTKEFMLSEAGYPTVVNTKLVLLIVHDKGKDYGHAILAVRLPKGSVAYLDLRNEPMTRTELQARGYEFFDWVA